MRNGFLVLLRRVLPVVLGFAALALGLPEAEAANPSPHKAVYRLSLEKTRDQSPITNVSGVLEFSWEDAHADGNPRWAGLRFRLVAQYPGKQGRARLPLLHPP
jgi:hypothetical protein